MGLQVDRFEDPDRDTKLMATAYVCFVGLATCQLTQVTLECVTHLVYTEMLTESGVIRYIISSAYCVGRPVFATLTGTMHLFVAICLWVAVAYGLAQCVMMVS